MRESILALLGAAMIAAPAYGDFLPENNLHLEDNVNFTAGITEDEFNAVIDEAEEVFTPIIKDLGGKLKIARKWENATVNASAMQLLGTWYVNMYGGLARRAETTRDGFAMVLCHEIGHHIAGFPYSSSWAANEGQSDYFAALACARLLWGDEKEINAQARSTIEAFPKELCDDRFSNRDDQNLCYRQMLANHSIAGLLAALNGETISFETTDDSEVSRTDNKHPAAQCRLDTYVAGSLCTASWDFTMIPKTEADSNQHACTDVEADARTVRPRCWFKPAAE